MDAIEKRARELLAAEYRKAGANPAACELMAGRASWPNQMALNAIVAALTPPEGSDQNLLELAATFETCIAFLPPAGRRNIAKAVDQLRYKGMTNAGGHVVVTRNEAGHAVGVTRQDDEGRILSVIAEFEAPEGHVSMDKGPWIVHNDGEAVISGDFTHDVWLRLTGDFCPDSRKLYAEWLASVLNAARPEVP